MRRWRVLTSEVKRWVERGEGSKALEVRGAVAGGTGEEGGGGGGGGGGEEGVDTVSAEAEATAGGVEELEAGIGEGGGTTLRAH